MSSTLDKGRAPSFESIQYLRMKNDEWRSRLKQELKNRKRSMRSVSLGADLGENYLSGILKEGKEPSLDNMISICRELGVSLSYITDGVEITPEKQDYLRLLENADPENREIALRLLGLPKQP